jgi:hypothetical protein
VPVPADRLAIGLDAEVSSVGACDEAASAGAMTCPAGRLRGTFRHGKVASRCNHLRSAPLGEPGQKFERHTARKNAHRHHDTLSLTQLYNYRKLHGNYIVFSNINVFNIT